MGDDTVCGVIVLISEFPWWFELESRILLHNADSPLVFLYVKLLMVLIFQSSKTKNLNWQSTMWLARAMTSLITSNVDFNAGHRWNMKHELSLSQKESHLFEKRIPKRNWVEESEAERKPIVNSNEERSSSVDRFNWMRKSCSTENGKGQIYQIHG